MAINYLKKTNLNYILNDIFNIFPKIKYTHYSFYRGNEWLYYSDDDFMYEIYAMNGGTILSVQKSHYDENDNVVIDYREILNGYGKKNYVFPIKAGV